jgi:hypothetical protein
MESALGQADFAWNVKRCLNATDANDSQLERHELQMTSSGRQWQSMISSSVYNMKATV